MSTFYKANAKHFNSRMFSTKVLKSKDGELTPIMDEDNRPFLVSMICRARDLVNSIDDKISKENFNQQEFHQTVHFDEIFSKFPALGAFYLVVLSPNCYSFSRNDTLLFSKTWDFGTIDTQTKHQVNNIQFDSSGFAVRIYTDIVKEYPSLSCERIIDQTNSRFVILRFVPREGKSCLEVLKDFEKRNFARSFPKNHFAVQQICRNVLDNNSTVAYEFRKFKLKNKLRGAELSFTKKDVHDYMSKIRKENADSMEKLFEVRQRFKKLAGIDISIINDNADDLDVVFHSKRLNKMVDRIIKLMRQREKTHTDSSYNVETLNGFLTCLCSALEDPEGNVQAVLTGGMLSRYLRKVSYYNMFQFLLRIQVEMKWLVTDGDVNILNTFEDTYRDGIAIIGDLHLFLAERDRCIDSGMKKGGKENDVFNDLWGECAELIKDMDLMTLESKWLQKMMDFLKTHSDDNGQNFYGNFKYLKRMIVCNAFFSDGLKEILQNNLAEIMHRKLKRDLPIISLCCYYTVLEHCCETIVDYTVELMKLRLGIRSEFSLPPECKEMIKYKNVEEKKELFRTASSLQMILDLQLKWSGEEEVTYVARPFFVGLRSIQIDRFPSKRGLSIDLRSLGLSKSVTNVLERNIITILDFRLFVFKGNVYLFDKQGFTVLTVRFMFCEKCGNFFAYFICEHIGVVAELLGKWDWVLSHLKKMSEAGLLKRILKNDEGIVKRTGFKKHQNVRSNSVTYFKRIVKLTKKMGFDYRCPRDGTPKRLSTFNLNGLHVHELKNYASANGIVLKSLKLKDEMVERIFREELIKNFELHTANLKKQLENDRSVQKKRVPKDPDEYDLSEDEEQQLNQVKSTRGTRGSRRKKRKRRR